MAVSKTPDTGVTEPGIFNDFSRMAIKGSSQRVSIIGGMEQFQNCIFIPVVNFAFLHKIVTGDNPPIMYPFYR